MEIKCKNCLFFDKPEFLKCNHCYGYRLYVPNKNIMVHELLEALKESTEILKNDYGIGYSTVDYNMGLIEEIEEQVKEHK